MKHRHTRQQRDELHVGVTRAAIARDVIWTSVLPITARPGADDCEVRVARAWEDMKASCFAAEEYIRLRQMLARVIAKKQCGRTAEASLGEGCHRP